MFQKYWTEDGQACWCVTLSAGVKETLSSLGETTEHKEPKEKCVRTCPVLLCSFSKCFLEEQQEMGKSTQWKILHWWHHVLSNKVTASKSFVLIPLRARWIVVVCFWCFFLRAACLLFPSFPRLGIATFCCLPAAITQQHFHNRRWITSAGNHYSCKWKTRSERVVPLCPHRLRRVAPADGLRDWRRLWQIIHHHPSLSLHKQGWWWFFIWMEPSLIIPAWNAMFLFFVDFFLFCFF